MKTIDNADQLLREGKYREAIELLEEVRQIHPEEESVLLMLAWAYYDSGAKEKAVSFLEHLLQRELERKVFTGFAFDELVRIHKQDKNFPKLIETCTRAVAAQPDDANLLIELGRAYLLAGKTQESCDIFEKVVHLDSDNPAFYCLLGEALFVAGHTDESESAYRRAAAIDPEQLDRYYFKLADLFAKKGIYEEAQRLLKKCIKINPVTPVYHCCLGDALIGLGKIQEALDEYKTAASSDGANLGAYYNRLGNSLTRANYHHEAMLAFRTALKAEPDNPVYHRHLARSHQALAEVIEKAEISPPE